MVRLFVRVALAAALVVPLAACAKQESVIVPDVPEEPVSDPKEEARAAAEAAYNKHLDNGTKAFAAGDSDTAITYLKQATNEKPDGAEAHFQLGRVFLAKKDDSAALKAFTEAIRLNPQHADAYMERAAIHERNRKLNDASHDYRQVIDLEPDPKTTARAYWLYSDILDRQGKRADFRKYRERAMMRNPEYKKLVTAGDVLVVNHSDRKLTITFERLVNPDGTVRTFPPGFKCTVPDDGEAFPLDGDRHLTAKFVRFTLTTDHGSQVFEQKYEKGMTLEIHIYQTDLPSRP